jgi:HSP20 family protein
MTATKTPNANIAKRSEAGMTRWNIMDELADVRRRMDDIFNRPFGYTPLARLFPDSEFNFTPPVDIYTTDAAVFVYASVPGFTPESIHVEATGDTVSIRGERKQVYDADKAVPEQQSGMMEESTFNIHFSLPAEIDPNKVKCTLNHGILNLEMPKTEHAKTKSVKVQVKAG